MIHTATITYMPTHDMMERFKRADGTVPHKQNSSWHNIKFKDRGIIMSLYTKVDESYSNADTGVDMYINKSFSCIVNLSKLMKTNEHVRLYNPYTDFEELEKTFNAIMLELGDLAQLHFWNVKRIDYAVNVKTPYVKQYVKLLQRGDIPYNMRFFASSESGYEKPEEGSMYLYSRVRDKNRGKEKKKKVTGTRTINFYDKADQLTKKRARQIGADGTGKTDIYPEDIERARDILRLEVQFYQPGIQRIRDSAEYKIYSTKFIHYISKDYAITLCRDIVGKEVHAVGRLGDYCRRPEAIDRIKKSKYTARVKDRLIFLIEKIARSTVATVRKNSQQGKIIYNGKVYKDRTCYEDIKRLEAINVNPRTIRREAPIIGHPRNGEMEYPKEGLTCVYTLFDAALKELEQPEGD